MEVAGIYGMAVKNDDFHRALAKTRSPEFSFELPCQIATYTNRVLKANHCRHHQVSERDAPTPTPSDISDSLTSALPAEHACSANL